MENRFNKGRRPLVLVLYNRIEGVRIHEVSEEALGYFSGALPMAGYDLAFANIEDDIDRVSHAVEALRPQLIVNLVDHVFEDTLLQGSLAGMLDLYGYVYTGSDPRALFQSQDRASVHVLMQQAGLPVTPFVVVRDLNTMESLDHVGFPCMVTQAFDDIYDSGSERSLMHSQEEVNEHCQEVAAEYELPLLVERFYEGPRVHACILGNRVLEVLPLVRSAAGVCSVAQLDGYNAGRIRELARRAFRVAGLRDIGQIDFAFDEDESPVIVDVRACVDLLGPVVAAAAANREGELGGLLVDLLRQCHRRLPEDERSLYPVPES